MGPIRQSVATFAAASGLKHSGWSLRLTPPPGDVLTMHATAVISQRGIDPSWIGRVLEEPEELELDARDPALRHALRRIPEREMRVLRVVYNQHTNPWRVVTAYFDRKRSKDP